MMAKKLREEKTYLGSELGSTRIKACLIDGTYTPIATGGYEWENQFENGYWTYDLSLVPIGLRACFADLASNYQAQYGEPLQRVDAIGISGMMHGYLPFDVEGNLLTPFRTWRNTTTSKAAEELNPLPGSTSELTCASKPCSCAPRSIKLATTPRTSAAVVFFSLSRRASSSSSIVTSG